MLNVLRNANLTLVVLICFVLIASRLCSANSSVYNPHNTQSNLQWIDYVNSLHLSFNLAENRFADMTNSEFKANFLGLNTSSLRLNSDYVRACEPSGNVPAAVDWRKEGAVTPHS